MTGGPFAGSSFTGGPFADSGGSFVVLLNEHDQHCLWPSFARVPEGWRVVHGPGTRTEALTAVAAATPGPPDPSNPRSENAR